MKHTEKHRFLNWGPQDSTFKSWVTHFRKKNTEFEIGEQRNAQGEPEYTIYKHNLYTDMSTGMVTPCCKACFAFSPNESYVL